MGRVLIIDDNELVGKMVTQLLSMRDYAVESINSPFGVLNKVKAFQPDVILLDFNMPGLKGDRLARLLMDHRDNLKPFKVILFSSEEEDILKEMANQLLVDDYFMKSRPIGGLADLVSSHMQPDARPMDA